MPPFRSLRSLLHRDDGVAAVEFALILPLLVLLFFGTVEISNLLIADSKLRHVTASISDLLTQKSNATVSEVDMNVANIAAQEVMMPLPIAGRLEVLMTTYRPDDETEAHVLWTRLIEGGVIGNKITSSLGLMVPSCTDTSLPPELLPPTATSPMNDVLMVTAAYRWSPWFLTIFDTDITLRATNYNMPRYSLVLNPGPTLTPPCPP